MIQTVLAASFLLTLGTAVTVVSIGFAQGDFETPAEALTWASEIAGAAMDDLR